MQLAAAPLARDAIPAVESSAWAPFLAAWVHEAFVHARDAQRVPKRTRHAGTPDAVACGVTPSAHTGRLRGAHWHTRASRHRVPYDTFVRGLFDNHTPNEREYIESLASVMCVDALQPPHVAVWDNAYRLPWPTSSRDFVELVFCIPLPPHAEPFSEAHEQRAMELAPWLRGAPPLPAPAAGERRAFLVLSQPVAYAPLPGHLRAYYASVEAVHEVSAEETEWL
ncbi:hypothetical protein GLX27_004558 [Malassezia furfur]|uniref:DUF3074 domain-containing protein n=1 Tax=Malassezia furfur TaxID=55194 RepID=A0ABY8EWC5_MALFU|nr:hypothetical protein GLX27_004558 [Malassezia furfur]